MNKRFDELADKMFADFDRRQNWKNASFYLSRQTNELLDFEEYVGTLNVQDIQPYDPLFKETDLSDFNRFIHDGVEKYLCDNIKTIAIK